MTIKNEQSGTIRIDGDHGVASRLTLSAARKELTEVAETGGFSPSYAELLHILVQAHEAAQRCHPEGLRAVVMTFGRRA